MSPAPGLIPAHAGKTRLGGTRGGAWRGSSPLTRGKPGRYRHGPRRRGLIPAHAGKTRASRAWMTTGGAHPRSRGENWGKVSPKSSGPGSSPLTRGKLTLDSVTRGKRGLIPAHAGKTLPGRLKGGITWAHPRSRGENALDARRLTWEAGSSPLTRGKRPAATIPHADSGLIPAHAGKTKIHGC